MTHSRRDAVLFKGRVGEKSECVCVRVCSGRGSWIIMSINTDDETAPVLYRGSAESEPLLGSVAESEGEGEVEALPSKVARIRSLKAVLLTNFLSATGFSLLLSTMWPYLRDMTDSGTGSGGGGGMNVTGFDSTAVGCATDASESGYKAKLGYVVAAFSVGQLVGGPFFGWYSTRRPYAETFIMTIVIRMLGNLLYASIGGLPLDHADKFDVLIASRLVVGFGAGSMAVCNAYITGATTLEERTAWIGLLAGTGGLGFIVGPLIGSCFGKVPSVSASAGGGVSFTLSYTTAPAYVASLFCVMNIFVLLFMFKDCSLIERTNEKKKKDHVESETASSNRMSIKNRDLVAVGALLVLYFGNMFVLSIFETIGLPLTMDEFSWSPADADINNGIISGVGGIQTVFFFMSAKNLAGKYGERKVLAIGLAFVVVSQLAGIPFAGKTMKSNEYCCDHWCKTDPELTLGQYFVSAFFINIGFPLASVMIFTLYSYALGPFHQGSWMGIINGFGSLARIVGPVMITMGYSFGGPRMIFSASACLSALVFFVFSVFSPRLVPFGTRVSGAYEKI
eukprot:m.230621 g.230621  ORF g.230621 m.230621 type:complete len:565 (-) comp26030_c0_seq9:389-2083(-)